MRETIRWGVLGPGGIARRFAEGLRSLEDAKLVAVGSRSIERAKSFASEFGAARAWGSYEELAADPEVDAIYIATPHIAHAACSILVLEHGKAALCEKPFTLTAAEARRVAATARRKGVFCMEAMWTRFLPSLVELRKLLGDGLIGETRMLLADFGFRFEGSPTHRLLNPELGGGALLDVGVYPISLASMVFGEPQVATGVAHLGPTGVDEQTSVLLKYAGGRIACCTCAVSTDTPQGAFVAGTKGSIDLGRGWWSGKPLTVTAGGETRQHDPPRKGNGYNYEAAEVGRCLREGLKESSVMSLDESVRIMETLDRVRRPWGLRYPGE